MLVLQQLDPKGTKFIPIIVRAVHHMIIGYAQENMMDAIGTMDIITPQEDMDIFINAIYEFKFIKLQT